MRRGLLFGALAALALSGDDSESVWVTPPPPPPGGGGGAPGTNRAHLEGWLAKSGIPGAWQRFLLFVAAGESGFNINVSPNESVGEAKAAKIAYDRNAAKLVGCGHPESDYTFGSGGWFGFLGPYTPLNLPKSLRCVNPVVAMRSPELNITAAVNFGRYLLNASASDTVVSIRSGWGWPAKLNDPERLANKRPIYQARARKLGWPESYVDTVLPPMGLTPAQVYANLTAVIA